ncbi:DUF1203 domain-containing protein [Denitrobaculum tricleocarpae]|uniref:DUF1203 domain-containing protein n=1 Tax=Denitrobaculum tricleocarpae TaxID=2591009 RepID=A0A545TG16_9PROT|nr:DUF1203 domain-containing protein [Denitrobaculum tricleocarpae]TQV76121.1 DUF1203 domain-containing protein [Denitrobaculum tricleocarpae]
MDRVPELLRARALSLRGFDTSGMTRETEVIDGTRVEEMIARIFSNPEVSYIHIHNAAAGCYHGRVERV